MPKLTRSEVSFYAQRGGFTLIGPEKGKYAVREPVTQINTWTGTLAECYAWLAGWVYKREHPV